MSDAYVWIDPARRSGEPCIGGHRLPVEMVCDAVWSAGVEQAIDLWCLARQEVLVACWYAGVGYPVRLHNNRSEYRPYRGPWRKRWGTWAADVHQALWSVTTVDYDAIADPPTALADDGQSYADVPEGYHVREDPDHGEILVRNDPAALAGGGQPS
jgi:hypothetical protein